MHLRNSWIRSMSSCATRQVPSGASGGRGVNGLSVFLARKFQETLVTRSLMSGKVCIGSAVIGLFLGRSLSRGMAISFRNPFVSHEDAPHFLALQFHSTA